MHGSQSGAMAGQWLSLARLLTVRRTTPSRPAVVSGTGGDGCGRAVCPGAGASQVFRPAPRRWRSPVGTAAFLVARDERAFVELTTGAVA